MIFSGSNTRAQCCFFAQSASPESCSRVFWLPILSCWLISSQWWKVLVVNCKRLVFSSSFWIVIKIINKYSSREMWNLTWVKIILCLFWPISNSSLEKMSSKSYKVTQLDSSSTRHPKSGDLSRTESIRSNSRKVKFGLENDAYSSEETLPTSSPRPVRVTILKTFPNGHTVTLDNGGDGFDGGRKRTLSGFSIKNRTDEVPEMRNQGNGKRTRWIPFFSLVSTFPSIRVPYYGILSHRDWSKDSKV